MYPLSSYAQSTADEKPYEKPLFHEITQTFPHKFSPVNTRNYFRLRQSPYGNSLTLDFSSTLIRNEKLGGTGQTDMICVSLSSTDYIGHRFGPNSLEVEDVYLRLDKDLEVFLNELDNTVGKNNYLVFLTADHGAPQAPDFMKENHLPGGSLNSWELVTELNKMCRQKFQTSFLVQAIFEYQVYLDHKLIDSLNLDIITIKKTIIDYLKWKPEVVNAFDFAEFYRFVMPATIKERFANGYYFKRVAISSLS